jgi:thiol-disulfide isomerase/thioredoxin
MQMNRVLVALLLAIALASGVYLYTARHAGAPVASQAEPDPASQTDASTNHFMFAERRPEFSLPDTANVVRSAAEWDGSALVVNFWATWCAPCRREMPLLNQLQERHREDGIQVLGIAMDFREDVLGYLEQSPVNYPVLIGEMEAMEAAEGFGVSLVGLPITAFTDHRGNILYVHLGELHETQASLIFEAVMKLQRGETGLDQAREAISSGLSGL